jgi:hypothetical protein
MIAISRRRSVIGPVTRPLHLLFLGWLAGCSSAEQVNGSSATPHEDQAEGKCPISAAKGPWDYYQVHDLPAGVCGEAPACTVMTKDSCPGTDSPGPTITWRCVCDSGSWRCDEEGRSRTVCAGQ